MRLFVSLTFIIVSALWYQFYRQKKIEKEWAIKINPFEEKLSTIINKEYISHSFFIKLSSEHKDIRSRVKKTRKLSKKFPLFFQFHDSDKYRKSLNASFMYLEKERIDPIFKQNDEKWFWLTKKQLEWVICDEDAVLVNAWAWTGKTKTIEWKVVYLNTEKHIPLNKILVITFSKKSQLEMLDRIKKTLNTFDIDVNKKSLKKHISTFHAFWYWILKEAYGNFVYNEEEDGKDVWIWFTWKRVIEDREQDEVIHHVYDKIKKDKRLSEDLIEFLLYFTSPQHKVSDFPTKNQYYEVCKKDYRTQLINERWFNITVKSYWELIIANYLWSCGINVQYEPKNHYIKNDEWNKIPYRPDFYLPDYDIYIEYFWVDWNNETADYIDAEDYVMRMNNKIEKHKNSWTKFIDLRYADYLDGWWLYLTKKLTEKLKSYWVKAKRIRNEEILKNLERPLNDLEKTLKTFLALFKESWENIESLDNKVESFDEVNKERNQKFFAIFNIYFELYTKLLNEWWYLDFWDMIVEATKLINEWKIVRKYSHILVDEFQDISPARANLIKAIIKDPIETRLFSVWDDWQSIYKFAWSNTNIFIDFYKYFWYTKNITLDRTFRFNQWISNISWQFVMENPKQSKKKLKSLDQSTKEKILIYQNDVMFSYDEDEEKNKEKVKDAFHYNNIFYRILDDHIENHFDAEKKQQELSILYLTRYTLEKYDKHTPVNFIRYFKNYIWWEKQKDESYLITYNNIEFKITLISLTVHKSKWLEADYVIVDFINQNAWYDFPSSMVDDPILDLVTENDKGAFPNAEERRVFYVSITRWKRLAFLVYGKGKESYFLSSLIKYKSNVVRAIQNNQWEELTLVENCEWDTCWKCWGILRESKFEKWLPEYYCWNYMVWCDSYYYKYKWNLYRFNHCPRSMCDWRMVMRTNKNDGSHFLWCSNYPNCEHSENLDENQPLNKTEKIINQLKWHEEDQEIYEDTIRDNIFEDEL